MELDAPLGKVTVSVAEGPSEETWIGQVRAVEVEISLPGAGPIQIPDGWPA